MENMQDLLSDPMFIMQAESRSMIPQQYAATLTDQEIQGHLTRIEVVNRRSPSPVLESGPALPAVKPQTPILTPVAEPYVEPVVVPAPAATQPAPALTSGNGSVNYSDLVRANGALSATEGDRSGAYQPWDYTMGAIAEPLPDKQAVVVDASNQPPAPVLEGYHQMPDGSMMPNSEMSNSTGLTPNPADDRYATSPVLADPTKPSPTTAALTNVSPTDTSKGTTGGSGTVNGGLSATARTASGGSTGNARGSNMAYSKIGTGESLIRIGGAMYSGALQGNGLGAATQEYGSIQDANRASEAEAFKQAEATRLAELRANRVGAGKGKSGNLAGPPTAVYKEATLSAITRIKDLLGKESGFNPFDNLTGWTGSLLSAVPGTPAHDTLNSINTIEAAVGFDRLQKMRDDSPTGGALGQVTERELALLSQSLGSLKQSSSREQFVANLNAVEKHYQAAVAAVEAQQAAWYQMNGGTSPPNAAPAAQEGLTSKAAAFLE